jgi:hypothetical protein
VVVRIGAGDGLLYLEPHTTGGTIDQLLKEPSEGKPGPRNGLGALDIRILDAAGRQLSVVTSNPTGTRFRLGPITPARTLPATLLKIKVQGWTPRR